MAKRLTDKKKKKIIADYAMNQNYRETGRINGISDYAVKKIVQEFEPNVQQEIAQKAEENTQTVLDYMETLKDKKIKLVTQLLDGMIEKSEKLDMFTNIKDLASAYGIIFDKELKVIELRLKEKQVTEGKKIIIEDLSAIADKWKV